MVSPALERTPTNPERPFSTTPNPRYLYLAPQYKKVLNHALATVIEGYGLMIMAGPIGCGKSTLVRNLAYLLDDALMDKLALAVIYNPSFTTEFSFLKGVCKEFGLQPRARMSEQIEDFRAYLFAQHQAGKTCVLVVDEAHKLSGAQLEVVREFFNFAHDERFYLQVILAGESDPMRHKLKNKKAISSRAAYSDEFNPLTLEESSELIRFRLGAAGWYEDLFEFEALALLHEASRGVPRNLVKLGRCVFDGFGKDVPKTITCSHVQAAIDENPGVLGYGL